LLAADLNAMEAGTDRAQGDVMKPYGPTAGLPVSDPLLEGRLYFESDLLRRVWRDNGAGWDDVTPFAGNGLLNNLIAYWPGNEVAGNALDLHTNALHLTDVNGVTSNPGVVYPWSRQYTRALNRYHTRPGDDALLSTGDVDFTIAACVWLDSKIGVETIASKDTMAMPNREYWLGYFLAGDRFFLQLTDGTVGTAIANTLGAPALGAWYLVIGWHDSVANTVNIQVNNGGADVVGTVGAPADTAAIFQIGRTLANQWDGRIGPTMFWKSAPGAGGVKTPAERLALWNGGTPLRYDQFTV